MYTNWIILSYSFENDGIDFIFVLLVGSGFLLTSTGKYKSENKI